MDAQEKPGANAEKYDAQSWITEAAMSANPWRPRDEFSASAGKVSNRYDLEFQLKNSQIAEKKGWFSPPCNNCIQSLDHLPILITSRFHKKIPPYHYMY